MLWFDRNFSLIFLSHNVFNVQYDIPKNDPLETQWWKPDCKYFLHNDFWITDALASSSLSVRSLLSFTSNKCIEILYRTNMTQDDSSSLSKIDCFKLFKLWRYSLRTALVALQELMPVMCASLKIPCLMDHAQVWWGKG